MLVNKSLFLTIFKQHSEIVERLDHPLRLEPTFEIDLDFDPVNP
jgi:hypothetical protein